MNFLKKTIILFLICIFFILQNSFASNISNIYAIGQFTLNDNLSLNTKFNINFPEELKYILIQGVPIFFNLTYSIKTSIFSSYRFKIKRLLNRDAYVIEYKLVYNPFTKKYLVIRKNEYYFEHKDLNDALKTIGRIFNWEIKVDFNNIAKKNPHVLVKLSLNISKLPKPYQIKAITTNFWDLDSKWVNVQIQ